MNIWQLAMTMIVAEFSLKLHPSFIFMVYSLHNLSRNEKLIVIFFRFHVGQQNITTFNHPHRIP